MKDLHHDSHRAFTSGLDSLALLGTNTHEKGHEVLNHASLGVQELHNGLSKKISNLGEDAINHVDKIHRAASDHVDNFKNLADSTHQEAAKLSNAAVEKLVEAHNHVSGHIARHTDAIVE